MDTHELRLKLLKSPQGMAIPATLSDQEVAARIKLIIDLYLSGYPLYRELQYDPTPIKINEIPRNFTCTFRLGDE